MNEKIFKINLSKDFDLADVQESLFLIEETTDNTIGNSKIRHILKTLVQKFKGEIQPKNRTLDFWDNKEDEIWDKIEEKP